MDVRSLPPADPSDPDGARHVPIPTTDGLQLYGRLWPTERLPRAVVVLVHGLGDHSGRHGQLARALNDVDCACLAGDLRGHGRSPGQRGHASSLARLRQDLTALLQQARRYAPHPPLLLVGLSMGGTLALSLVLRERPELDGLIALSPLIYPAVPPPAWKWYLGRVCYYIAPRISFDAGIADTLLTRDPERLAWLRADRLRHKRITARLAWDLLQEGRWLATQAAQLNCPLLLMHGTSDGITSFEGSRAFAAAAPEECCVFRAWEGMYHELLQDTRREEVLRVLIEFCLQRSGGS